MTVDFYNALVDDDDERCALFNVLLNSEDEKRAARSLRGEEAKSFMQILKQASVHSSELVINTAQGWNYRH